MASPSNTCRTAARSHGTQLPRTQPAASRHAHHRHPAAAGWPAGSSCIEGAKGREAEGREAEGREAEGRVAEGRGPDQPNSGQPRQD